MPTPVPLPTPKPLPVGVAVGVAPDTVTRFDRDGSSLPKFGDYVYVEELPEAVTRVAPVYPDAARAAGVEGIVMVQALVTRDGSVADVRMVKSIPPLDGAAIAAVRQWKFAPARSHGQPVAVWLGVPVRFSLH